MASNGLDRQINFLNTFFPIKYLNFFVSIVYLNLFLINVVVPPAIYFCLSSISCLNSSAFSRLNLVYFFEFCFPLKLSLFFSLCYHLIHINPCKCFSLPLFPCEFHMRAFFPHHYHHPPLQQTSNLLFKH
jgi:hypothetical protein